MMRRLRNEDAFTLPELLVGMTLMSIVLVAFGQMLISSSRTSNRVEEQAVLQSEVRASIDRLTTDLRQATNTHGTSPVVSVSPTALTFDSPDRATPFHIRRISYQMVGGSLQRSTVTSTDTDGWPWTFPVAPASWIGELTSVTNGAVFAYFDQNGAATTDPNAVNSVRVTLTVRPRQNQALPATFSALVNIRTLQ
jgi:prepilin-type N-terminal cleavage/methylation domain-containing protein